MSNKIKNYYPSLRFPEFYKTKDWSILPISNFLEESKIEGSRGNTAKKITVKLWGKGVTKKSENYHGSIATQYFKRKSGQFIYSKLDFLNQAFGIIPDELDGFESTIDLPCFDFKGNIVPLFFLKYVMRPIFYKKNGEVADGGRKAKRIQQSIFLNFPIAVPEIPEQQKIADCLSSLDELIEAHEQKLDTLKQLKKGLMQRLFPTEGETTPRWRFPEFRNAGEWVKANLGTLIAVAMCKRVFSEETSPEGDIPFYKIGTLGQEADAFISYALFQNYKNKYKYPRKGEILLTCSGTIGKMIRYSGEDAYYQDSNIVWLENDQNIIINDFLFFFLSKFNWSKLNVTTITRIYGDDLRKILLIFPKNHNEQQKIADCLTALDERIEAQEEKITALKEHKKGLMQQLFPSL